MATSEEWVPVVTPDPDFDITITPEPDFGPDETMQTVPEPLPDEVYPPNETEKQDGDR